MNKATIIAWKDFKGFFSSPVGYVVLALSIFINSWFFANLLEGFIQQGGSGSGDAPPMSELIVNLYGNINVIYMFCIPALTMGLFAEEKKMHTIELLLTSPVTLFDIVMGKFLAGFAFAMVMLGTTIIYPLTVMTGSELEYGPTFASYLGSLFMLSCYISVGLFFSALTTSQIVSFFATFITILFFWMIEWAAYSSSKVVSEIVTHFSIISHYKSFGRGLINTADLTYFFSFIGSWLFLTHKVMDSYRWR